MAAENNERQAKRHRAFTEGEGNSVSSVEHNNELNRVPNREQQNTEQHREPVRRAESETSGDVIKNHILETFKKYRLVPCAAPRRLINEFVARFGRVSEPCSYCGAPRASAVIPEIVFNQHERTATLVGRKVACKMCELIADQGKLNRHIALSSMYPKEGPDIVEQHFARVNNITERTRAELLNVHALSNSLQVIYGQVFWRSVYRHT
ncbi:uncharacterized protein BXIN_0637 [Babesia sp. Xinjiang]|uniref:uncharacterized protein n=1 Tax=Babesia sp. Xinjiang TaxID=462227 RepID=UPI000A2300AF|nr:uncharacterized protein BXIN_0637 [Babesia sp. Xinjiang]ORM41831.1 hypothetical protein BXIN_0637 [Babesia sp. Xinjiang]